MSLGRFYICFSNFVLVILVCQGVGPACFDDIKDAISWQLRGGDTVKPDTPDNPVEFQTIGSIEKVCFIGDNGDDSVAQQMVADALLQEGCTQVRIVGDIIYNNGLKSADSNRFETHFYNYYREMMEDNSVPFYLVMGNHDFRSDVSEWLNVAREHDNIIYPNYYYLDHSEIVCFLAIDTNGYFFDEQVNFFTEKLKDRDKCEFTIAFAHHPYISSGSHGDAKGDLKKFLEKTVIGHVDLYISGHDHQLSDEGDVTETRQLISGGGGKDLREISNPGVWGEKVFGFVRVAFEKKRINYSFIVVDEEGSHEAHSGSVEARGYRP